MVRRTLDDDVEVQSGSSGDVLDDRVVLSSLARLDAEHGQCGVSVAGLDVDVSGSRRQRDAAVSPGHLRTRRSGDADGQHERGALLHVLWTAVAMIDVDLRRNCTQ